MNSESIADVGVADDRLWHETWQRCEYATPFHSPAWARTWQNYSNGAIKPAPRSITFSDGRTAVVAACSERSGRFGVPQYLSSPAGTYGGWVSGDELSAEHRRSLAAFMMAEFPDLVWRLNPFEPGGVPEGLSVSREDVTHALPLQAGIDAIVKDWTKGHRSGARKAAREGVAVRPAESRADWDAFAQIYLDSVRRWGDSATSVYDERLLILLSALEPTLVRLWLAEKDGAPVAGALCLYSRNHVSYWLGGALEEFFPLRPVQLLLRETISDACARGLAWFDFNPSGGHEGVAAFKRGFGAGTKPAPLVTSRGRMATARASLGSVTARLRRSGSA